MKILGKETQPMMVAFNKANPTAGAIKVRYQATTRVPGEKVGLPTTSFDEAANLTAQFGGTKVIKYTGNYLPDAIKEEIAV